MARPKQRWPIVDKILFTLGLICIVGMIVWLRYASRYV